MMKEKFAKLFDETNDINENIVAMTFFMVMFLFFSFCFFLAGIFSFLNFIPAICFFIAMVLSLIGAFIFKAHEQGTLTGDNFVKSLSDSVKVNIEKK